jgi:demethylmenaquinone methyltransferase/2-methoxy-6-polyprenyl-1,4-benzoquinol methylase
VNAYRAPPGPDVQRMFAAIADRYDLLNRLLSFQVDRYWRRRAVRLIRSMESFPNDICLDLCTGTGDLMIDLEQRLDLQVVGADFCHPMLLHAQKKLGMGPNGSISKLSDADAMALPFREGTFRFVTIAFGLRNVEVMEQGLKEIFRVLEPGGNLIILEFSRPVLPVFRSVFAFYFSHILPRLGAWISGTEEPYQYLPDSVGRFPSQMELAGIIASVGFERVQYRNLTGGIAALHWGTKRKGLPDDSLRGVEIYDSTT